MQENEDFDIFNVDPSKINTHQRKTTSTIYNPKAKDVASGIYESTIRFLYNPKNPENSIIRKVVYFLKDETGSGSYFDSYQSLPNGWKDCVIGQLYSKLSKSDSAVDKKNAEELSRRDQYYSLIQIVDDKVNPDLNGKIMIFKYGIKLKRKLDLKLAPETGPVDDIMNFYTGKNFELYITRQGSFNEYGECHFAGESVAISIDGAPIENTDDDKAKVRALMADVPSLENYEFKSWDDKTRADVESILNLYRNPGEQVDAIVNESPVETTVPDPTTNGTAADVLESAPSESEDPAPAPTNEETEPVTETEAVKEGADDDVDQFLNKMGI